MTWSYRVVRAEDGSCRIAEVYEGPNTAMMYTEGAIAPRGDTLDELRTDIHRMMRALLKPVIDEATLRETINNETG